MFRSKVFLLEDVTENAAGLLRVCLAKGFVQSFYELLNGSLVSAIEKSSLNKIECTLGFTFCSDFYLVLESWIFFISFSVRSTNLQLSYILFPSWFSSMIIPSRPDGWSQSQSSVPTPSKMLHFYWKSSSYPTRPSSSRLNQTFLVIWNQYISKIECPYNKKKLHSVI